MPIYERDVSVDDILCSHQAGDVEVGRRTTLRQLVEELHARSCNLHASTFLKLELIQRGEPDSMFPSFTPRIDVGADCRLL